MVRKLDVKLVLSTSPSSRGFLRDSCTLQVLLSLRETYSVLGSPLQLTSYTSPYTHAREVLSPRLQPEILKHNVRWGIGANINL